MSCDRKYEMAGGGGGSRRDKSLGSLAIRDGFYPKSRLQ